ncbi:redox-sensitive bicupin YhaK (pirin superfamily) [Streptomyces sp. MJP52]|nr:redox-sensitive bicupin YhaK (pirin superfamily) [Streptomyces sp. MJP52]
MPDTARRAGSEAVRVRTVTPGRWRAPGGSGGGAGSVTAVTIDVRRAADRYPGGDPDAGITTRHSFSFGPHYDPDNLGFGPLVACNEERLEPGAGFDEHPHRHVEIVTWVLEGELTHRDSGGRERRVRPGDLQHLSAAAGVRHVERNDGTAPLRFLQMWLTPRAAGGEPGYTLVRELGSGAYELPEAGAVLHTYRLHPGENVALPGAGSLYLHLASGELRVGGEALASGDAVRVTGERALTAEAAAVAEFLVWEFTA